MIVFAKKIDDTIYEIIHSIDHIDSINYSLIDKLYLSNKINKIDYVKKLITVFGVYRSNSNEYIILDVDYTNSSNQYTQIKGILNTEIIRYNRSLQTTEILN